jgi:dihydrofolate reductase
VRVAVAAVTSVDGKLTKHDEADIYQWVSDADQQNFRNLIGQHDVILMGRGSYEAVQHNLKLDQNRLRIVLTTHLERFAGKAVANQLEFYDDEPKRVVEMLEGRGYKNLLIVGGGEMITDFIEAKLVNTFHLTVEPRLFGTGKPLTAAVPIDTRLRLEDWQILNEQGTALLTYRVITS